MNTERIDLEQRLARCEREIASLTERTLAPLHDLALKSDFTDERLQELADAVASKDQEAINTSVASWLESYRNHIRALEHEVIQLKEKEMERERREQQQ